MLIFLDFDGVLRCEHGPLYQLEAPLLQRFEAALRELPGADVVIASSWREAWTLAEIRAHFAEDIRPRIVGATPIILTPRGDHRRYREVVAYMRKRDLGGRAWVALDDQQEHYPQRPNILILESAIGFHGPAAEWLLEIGRRYGAGLPGET